MKNRLLVLVLLSICSLSAFAQSPYSIKGSVVDTTTNVKLVNTAISLLNAKDSTLVKHTRALSDGTFSMTNLPKGKFILLVTYHGYADYVEQFTLDSVNRTRDVGTVKLMQKALLLKEVMITGSGAIKIKGDTTEFNAASYKIQPNDRVEDLLKQFPGIQVDKDGKITAQGQAVNKVLVDGEEFFGDDPTLVTRNIRADMVDKVQLFDKKSDQAAFTGIDDGVRQKTLNVTLKADSKNGMFGKVDAGKAPTDGYYQGQAMVNSFKAKQKLSAYGTFGNTNRTGLGYQDASKYGVSQLQSTPDGLGFFIGGGNDELESFSGTYSGQGLPTTETGGVHYDTKWNNDKESINLNYKIGGMDVTGQEFNLTQNNLPTGALYTNRSQNNSNSLFRQKLDATYQVALTSTWNLKISADGTLKNSKLNNAINSQNTRENETLQNTQARNVRNDQDQKTVNATVFLTKKFKKVGRTTSLTLSNVYNDSQTDGYTYSLNSFYNTTGLLDSTRLVDQYKPTDAISNSFNTNITYTEPFTKTFSVTMNYGLNLSNSTSDNLSYNPSAPGKYDVFDNVYSNRFDVDAVSNNGGAIFNYTKGKTVVNFGSRISAVTFDQTDLIKNKVYDRSYLNWTPQASYQYRFNQQKSFNVRYTGTMAQPTLQQLQPVLVNTDPLNITVGNPDLKPAFRHNFSIGYNSYKFITGQSFYVSGNVYMTDNVIVNSINTDAAGKSVLKSVNITDKTPYAAYLYFDFSRKIFNGIQMGMGGNVSNSKYYTYTNNVLNANTNQVYSGSISFYKSQPKKYDFSFNFGPSYTFSGNTLQKNRNNNSFNFYSYQRVNFFLPHKFQITADGNYRFNGKSQALPSSNSVFLVNTALTKKFYKKENLALSLSGNDLLNQNNGFYRNSDGGGMLTQRSYTTIKRYVLLSLIWDFTKMGGGAAATPAAGTGAPAAR